MAAYFIDHDTRSYEMIARVFAGESEGLTRDDVLDNIIYWTMVSIDALVSVGAP